MKEIDLMPFVGKESGRPYLHQPFTIGEFTYATNGRVLVRVPRRADAGPAPPIKELTVEKVIADAGDPPMVSFPAVAIPEPSNEMEDCEACNGRGYEHDCPGCGCICEKCGGKGEVIARERMTVGIGEACFQAKYIRLLMALPGLRVPPMPDPLGPMPFTFDGGRGALMPINGAYEMHIVAIEPEKVPA